MGLGRWGQLDRSERSTSLYLVLGHYDSEISKEEDDIDDGNELRQALQERIRSCERTFLGS